MCLIKYHLCSEKGRNLEKKNFKIIKEASCNENKIQKEKFVHKNCLSFTLFKVKLLYDRKL